jgi:ribosome biogenesis SPOUT family RNA methylase Rps3
MRGALIVGDDPPRDRTGELRKLGFEGRHLKEVQMTTDTAVGVSKRVVEDKGASFLHLQGYI